MGASSACCENLPQMPGRSSLVLFLACSFLSSETNTIFRQFSVHLTFQAEDPARNHFSTLTPTPATLGLRHHLLFPLKSCCLGGRQCIPGNSAEPTLCSIQVGKCLDSRWKMTARNSHPPPKGPWASITFTSYQPHQPSLSIWELRVSLSPEFPKLYWTNWGLFKDSQTVKFFTAMVQKVW